MKYPMSQQDKETVRGCLLLALVAFCIALYLSLTGNALSSFLVFAIMAWLLYKGVYTYMFEHRCPHCGAHTEAFGSSRKCLNGKCGKRS